MNPNFILNLWTSAKAEKIKNRIRPYIKSDIASKWIWRERTVANSHGNNAAVPYIIRRADPTVGLGSLILTFLGRINYAKKRGLIPVIDMRSYPNQYIPAEEIGKTNAWELFFRQPDTLDLDTAMMSATVVYGSGYGPENEENWPRYYNLHLHKEELLFWSKCFQEYICLNESSEEVLELQAQKLSFDKYKTLGVLLRGTDYLRFRPKDHPVQPEIDLAQTKIRELVHKKNYEKIFLATEDIDIYHILKDEWGRKLVTTDSNILFPSSNTLLCDITLGIRNECYLRGLDYIIKLYLLSKCAGLMGGQTAGSNCALLMGANYEDVYLFDLGKY